MNKKMFFVKYVLVFGLLFGLLFSFNVMAVELPKYYPKNDLSALGKSVEAVGLGGTVFSSTVGDEAAMDNVALSGGFLRSDLSLNTTIYYSSFLFH